MSSEQIAPLLLLEQFQIVFSVSQKDKGRHFCSALVREIILNLQSGLGKMLFIKLIQNYKYCQDDDKRL